MAVSRRKLLQGAAFASAAAALGVPRFALGALAESPRPFPLAAVRLKPSPWLDAVDSNRAYLKRLEPDRLLHNYREQAGLPAKALTSPPPLHVTLRSRESPKMGGQSASA